MAPKQTDPQFKLRMTPEIKAAIEEAAIANNRSMNAEILARLQRTIDEERFIKTAPGEAEGDSYLAKLTAERLKFEDLLGQYIAIFQDHTPADIKRMFDFYETIRARVEMADGLASRELSQDNAPPLEESRYQRLSREHRERRKKTKPKSA